MVHECFHFYLFFITLLNLGNNVRYRNIYSSKLLYFKYMYIFINLNDMILKDFGNSIRLLTDLSEKITFLLERNNGRIFRITKIK